MQFGKWLAEGEQNYQEGGFTQAEGNFHRILHNFREQKRTPGVAAISYLLKQLGVPAAVTDVVEAWGEEERGLEKEVPHWVFWAWILFGISSQETFAVVAAVVAVVVVGVVAELE